MSNFLFVYHGGRHPETDEEVAEVMAAWRNWLSGMGEAVIDGGNPVGISSTVQADGAVTGDGGANPASGYSIIRADSLEAAVTHAQGCPIRAAGGSIEVAEIFDMG